MDDPGLELVLDRAYIRIKIKLKYYAFILREMGDASSKVIISLWRTSSCTFLNHDFPKLMISKPSVDIIVCTMGPNNQGSSDYP